MRKDSGFEVMDHIHVGVIGNDVIAQVMQKNAEEICADTLCDGILYDTVTENEKSWNINGEKVTLSVKKL